MNNTENLIKLLNEGLTKADKLWDDKEVSHTYIVGYLQGIIKIAITALKQLK